VSLRFYGQKLFVTPIIMQQEAALLNNALVMIIPLDAPEQPPQTLAAGLAVGIPAALP
jgi:hypothetical protein